MIGILLSIAQITGGILLGIATLDQLDGESNFFNKIADALEPFQTAIGGILIILPLITFRSSFIYNTLSLLGGILLLTHVFGKVPSLETTLRKLSDQLMPFKALIGISLLIIGLLRLF
jgi:hypothetical protein